MIEQSFDFVIFSVWLLRSWRKKRGVWDPKVCLHACESKIEKCQASK